MLLFHSWGTDGINAGLLSVRMRTEIVAYKWIYNEWQSG